MIGKGRAQRMTLKEGKKLNVVRRTKKSDINMKKLTGEALNSASFSSFIRRIELGDGGQM